MINPTKSQKIDELSIKAHVINELRRSRKISKATVLANEFRIGTTGVRADLALVNGQFIGVEIKSKFDSLRRLQRQLPVYRSTFEKNILVIASRHLPKLSSMDLAGFELWEIHENGRIELHAERNRVAEMSNPEWLAMLTEAERRRVPLDASTHERRAAFIAAFRRRYESTTAEFWAGVGRKKVRPSDLLALSLYRSQRIAHSAWATAQADKWSDWVEKSKAILGSQEG
jgi:hypothetical protein